MVDWRLITAARGVLGALACAGALLTAACSQQPSPDAYAEPPPPPPPRAELLGAPPETGPAYRPEAPPPRDQRYAQGPPPYQPPPPQAPPVVIAMAPIPNPPEEPARAHRGGARRHDHGTVRVYPRAASQPPVRTRPAPRRSVRVYPQGARPAYVAPTPARRGHAAPHPPALGHAAPVKPAPRPVAKPAAPAAKAPVQTAPVKTPPKAAAPVKVAKAAPPVAPVVPKVAAPAPLPAKPAPAITLPAAAKPPAAAPPSAATNATAPTADRAGKLAALQMALTDTVAKTAVVRAPERFTAGQAVDVAVTIPAEFADTLLSEAQKQGLADVASSVNLTALMSGDGFSVTPMDMQWRPLTPGQPTEFHWQVTAMNGAKGPLHADLGADMMGAGAESLSLGSLKVGADTGMKFTPRVLGASLLVLIAAIVVAWLARGRGAASPPKTRRTATASEPAVVRPEPPPPPTPAHAEHSPAAHEPEPPPANDPEKS